MRSIESKLRIKLARQLSGRILDCGCGEGLFSKYLQREDNEVTSLDIDQHALSKIPEKTVVADCTQTPFSDDYFDAVWACAIIEHVEKEAMPEWIRITRPGGRIIVVTPNRLSPWDIIKRLFGLRTWWQHTGHVKLYDLKELKKYGPVYGETRFIPLMGWFFWHFPKLSHILILDMIVTKEMKKSFSVKSEKNKIQ